VAARRFREDLYYRVSALAVDLLPLRDPRRLGDIRPLLAHYIAKHERALKKKTRGLTRDALLALRQFAWPGNVRQLSNVCLCLVTHAAPGAWIDVADIRRLPEVSRVRRTPTRRPVRTKTSRTARPPRLPEADPRALRRHGGAWPSGGEPESPARPSTGTGPTPSAFLDRCWPP
jgi:transcriptional regulator with PAS, ATPase and Fis domain